MQWRKAGGSSSSPEVRFSSANLFLSLTQTGWPQLDSLVARRLAPRPSQSRFLRRISARSKKIRPIYAVPSRSWLVFFFYDEVSFYLCAVPGREPGSGRPDEGSSERTQQQLSQQLSVGCERDVARDAAHESLTLRPPPLPAVRLADHYDPGAEVHLCTHSESATPEFHSQGGPKEDEDVRLPQTV